MRKTVRKEEIDFQVKVKGIDIKTAIKLLVVWLIISGGIDVSKVLEVIQIILK